MKFIIFVLFISLVSGIQLAKYAKFAQDIMKGEGVSIDPSALTPMPNVEGLAIAVPDAHDAMARYGELATYSSYYLNNTVVVNEYWNMKGHRHGYIENIDWGTEVLETRPTDYVDSNSYFQFIETLWGTTIYGDSLKGRDRDGKIVHFATFVVDPCANFEYLRQHAIDENLDFIPKIAHSFTVCGDVITSHFGFPGYVPIIFIDMGSHLVETGYPVIGDFLCEEIPRISCVV